MILNKKNMLFLQKMIFINICYIILAVGVSKILTFYSWDFALMINVPQSSIYLGLTLGTIGSMLGKFLCGYFTDRYAYNYVLSISFFLMGVCFILEFMCIFPLNLYSFYILRIFQGFLSGILYSSILANLGEFYRDNDYQKFLTILTGGLGLAGPVFGILYIFCNLQLIIKCMLIVPIIGCFCSYYTVKNRDIKNIYQNNENKRSFKNYLYIIQNEKYLIIFALSFALTLINSLLILSNINRLFIIYLKINQLYLNNIIIRFCSVCPLLCGSLAFFIPKNAKYFILSLISIITIFSINIFLNNIILYLCFFTICYGLHLILIPHVSSLILLKIKENKDYYSYIIHAIRSFFYTILIWTFFRNFHFTDLYTFSIFCTIVNSIAGLLYFIGIFVFNKKFFQS
jgi:MFS family permease